MSKEPERHFGFTPEEVEAVMRGLPEDLKTKVFCINGEIVEVRYRNAIERLPYDIMPMQELMHRAIKGAGHEDVVFLSPMTSEMLLAEMEGKVVTNINKDAVNYVSQHYLGKPVFSDNQDGVLR